MFEQLRERMAATMRQMLENAMQTTGDVVDAARAVTDGTIQRLAEPHVDEDD